MYCPNCKSLLAAIEYEGITIETCSSCGGEWLDAAELGHIVKAREVRFDEDERRAIAAATKITPVNVKREDRDLACPKCNGQTDAINYGGDTGIVIDKCTSCDGIWLDQGELEKIQMLVEGWDDGLPDDMAKYGPRLRQIESKVDQAAKFKGSRFRFINSMINGVLGRW